MIRTIIVASAVLVSSVAGAEPRDEVIAAAGKLADSENYTWVSWVEADGHPLMGGPTTGMVQKGGYVTISLSRNSGICIVLKGDKAVLRMPQG